MKVNINAGGRQVEIEASDANVNPADLADKALQVWQATASAKPETEGAAFGLTPSGPVTPRRSHWELGEHTPLPVNAAVRAAREHGGVDAD